MSTPILYDVLSQKLEQKRKWHPSFKLLNIDENLFPNGIITFEAEAKDSNNKLKSVKDIVAESWKKGEKNHLMIQGEGGIGKTVTLLCLPVMFNDIFVPAIYIPLHELKGGENDDLIESYIKKRVLDDDEELVRQLKELRKKEWNNGPNLLLLLDGFNEISNEHRAAISENIEQWSEYPGIQIITSSRFDIHLYVALRSNFSKIELQPLSEDTVLGYLESNDIDAPKTSTVTKLITIPLMLTLYIKTETVRKQRPAPLAKFLETKNAGTLIWNYLQSELWRFRNNSREGVSCVLAMEFIAPYVAWIMQQHSEFFLNESSFLDRIDEAYNLMKKHIDSNGVFPNHIKTTLQQSTVFADNVGISKLLKESLCLFIGNEGNYRLMHQHFRDALAAIHLINSINLSGNNRPTEWNSFVDHYVMQFVADLIDEDEAIRLWEQNRTSPQLETATRNQLELQRRLHSCDFSKLDFSGLDLNNISLYPYRINNATIRLPNQSKRFGKTKLSEKTFLVEGHQDGVNAISITRNGKYIISGSSDSSIRIWDFETGNLKRILKDHENVIYTIATTPSEKYVISGSSDHNIRIWNLETGELRKTLEGHKGWVCAIAVTPNEKYIIGGYSDHAIRIWDFETGELRKTLEGHNGWVNAIAVTPNGKYVISGSSDYTIRIWDLETGEHRNTLVGHKDRVDAVTVTPNGKRVVSGSSDSTVIIWDIKTGELNRVLKGHEDRVDAVAVTPNGQYVVSSSSDTNICIWDLETGELKRTLKRHDDRVNTIAVTPNGKYIVSGSMDCNIHIWDLESGELRKSLEGHLKCTEVDNVVLSTSGRFAASKYWGNFLYIWDLETGELKKTLEGYKDWIYSIIETSSEKYIVSESKYYKDFNFWDLENGKLTKTLNIDLWCVDKIVVVPSFIICVKRYPNSISIFGIETGKRINTIYCKEDVTSLAVTLNEKNIINGSNCGTIYVWNLETGKLEKRLLGHKGSIKSIIVSPNGKTIVSGDSGGTICIWDLKTGMLIKSINELNSNICALAITPNGKSIVSGASDGTIYILDVKTGKYINKKIHESDLENIRITPNGRNIVSSASDGTICITDLKTLKVKVIQVPPFSLVGLDFSEAIISTPELKETLRQNGAKVDPD